MSLGRLREVPWDALRADLAVPAIRRVLAGEAAEREVDRTLRAGRDLSREERAALVEAIFGVALWRRRLAWHAGDSAIPVILLACLLRDLAGLDESRAALALTGLPGAKKNNYFFSGARSGEPGRLADRWSLPDWLETTLERELGAQAEAFCAAVAEPGPVCLRANRLRCTRAELADRLARDGIETRPARRAPDGLVVTTPRPNLFGSECWPLGWFEPQDEGSQLVGLLVAAHPGEAVLDLCAGAGGKSLLLAAEGRTVYAYDPDAERLDRLKARAARAGAGIEIGPPRDADCVLVDAPCSELGTLRRGPDARWRIDPAGFHRLEALQREILETAARHAGRRLVYATCTLRREENEDVAAAFEAAHPEFTRADAPLKLLPHLDGTDGFFAIAWERRRP
jgi:16S rRNA (cytosine967-C5)-methyltransferase